MKIFKNDSPLVRRRLASKSASSLSYQSLEPRQLLAGLPIITEFVASNSSGSVDDNGNKSDWIEIYNAGDAAINLQGYSLTDDADEPDRWIFPSTDLAAGQFLVVRAATDADPTQDSDLYTGFGLSSGGEYVGLYDSEGNVVSDFGSGGSDYPVQYSDVSYGVQFDGNFDQVSYFSTPTPGDINVGSFAGFTDRVFANVDAGFYENSFQVTLSTDSDGGNTAIGYTIDGSTPTLSNALLYTGPVTISSTTNLRAASFSPGFLSAPDRTWSYIFVDDVLTQSNNGQAPANFPAVGSVDRQLDYGIDPQVIAIEGADAVRDALLAIPTWSITTDIENLFDENTGIYTNPLEDGREWERAASVELLNPDGSEGFQVNAGLRIRGGFSRLDSNPKHSFRLFFRGEYGDSELEYPVHGNTGVDTFDRLDLRTAQNYSWSNDGNGSNNFIIDQFNRENQLALGQPSTRSSWLHLYLNGQYWGLYQTQERVDNNFAADYLGGDPDDYDVIKPDAGPGRPYVNAVTEGSIDAYDRLYQQAIARAADGITPAFADNAAYFKAQGLNSDGTRNFDYEVLLDVDNLIDYNLLIHHSGNFDAPITRFISDAFLNNYNAIRSRTGDHGFQFFIHDAEHSYLELDIDRTGPFNHPNFESGVDYFNPQWLHQQLMANDEYRIAFADRVQEVFFNDGSLSTNSLRARWNSLASKIYQAVIGESARWGDSRTDAPLLRSDWLSAVTDVRDNMLGQRTDIYLNQLRSTVLRLRNFPSDTSFNRVVNAPLFPSVAVPDFVVGGIPQHGGSIDIGQEIQLTSSSAGTIFYTTDGTDPRDVGGAVNAGAQNYGGTIATSTVVFAGSTWQYEDSGQDLGVAWRNPGFNDNAWSTGNGRFGFGAPSSNTTVNSGPSGDRHITTYFRKEFTLNGEYDVATLSINRDDGVVVYLNGVEVVRDNLPSGEITYDTLATRPIGGAEESQFVDFAIPASQLIDGLNTIAVEVHQINSGSSDLGFDAELTVGQQVTGEAILLNATTSVLSRTLAANGTWSPLQSANFVVANSVAPVSDLRISEINYNPHDPSAVEASAGVTDNDDFEFLELLNTSETGTIDLSGLRFNNGISFVFCNEQLTPGERAVIVRDIAGFQLRYGTDVRVLGQYTGSLSNGGERLTLVDSGLNEVISVSYDDSNPWSELADGSGTSLVLIDPDNTPINELDKYYSWRSSVEQGGSPGTAGLDRSGVVINEVLANPDASQVDAIELLNPTTSAINIGGWYLGDSASNPFQFQIPGGTVLNPGQYTVFDETDFNPTPLAPQSNHFGLSGSGGDEVYLSRIASPGILAFEDEVAFGASFNGESFGRDPNGSGRLTRLNADTLGSANSNAVVGPLVISEVNYHPGDPSAAALAIDPLLTDNDLEFIEIHNLTSSAVDTSNWRLRGEVDFNFPAGSLAAGDTWVLVSFSPTLNTNRLNAFRAHYGIGTDVTVLGPFSDDGSFLSNSSGRISLQQPDDPVLGVVPHVVVDEVVYDDLAPWADADGSSDSLNRISGGVNGNFASNWSANTPTPGVVNLVAESPQVVSTIRDGGAIARPDRWTTFSVQFSTDVNVSASSLSLVNDSLGGTPVDLSGIGFSYAAGTATWDLSSLSTPLDAAFYSVTLDSSSITSTAGGLALDGDGSGTAGGDFTTQVYQAIPGDANLDGTVDVLGDAFAVVANLGTTSGASWSQGDFNADGEVNVLDDAFILVANLNRSVLPPVSLAARLAESMAPTVAVTDSTPSLALASTKVSTKDSPRDSSQDASKRASPLAVSETPALAGSQQLDEAFASEDWLI